MFLTRHDVTVPVPSSQTVADSIADHALPERPARRSLRLLGPFGSLSQVAMSHLPQSGSKSRKESATGMEFPEDCCVLTHKDCPVLTGFG